MKLMIVDDEVQIRQGIKDGIDWKSFGFKEIMDAENGIEALKLFHANRPEIIITDIRMPGMDGLELSKCIRSLCEKSKIIILSGHSDFEYAKTALHLDVNEYELKPVRIRNLIEMVLRLKKKVEEEAANDAVVQAAKERQKIEMILRGEIIDDQEIRAHFKKNHQIDFDQNAVCIAVSVGMHKPQRPNQTHDVIFREAFMKELQRMLKDIGGIIIEKSARRMYILANCMNCTEFQFLLNDWFQRIHHIVQTDFELETWMGASGIIQLSRIPEGMAQAESALKNSLFYSDSHLSLYEDMKADQVVNPVSGEKERQMKECILRFDANSAKKIIADEFEQLNHSKGTIVFQAKALSRDYILILWRTLDELGIELKAGRGEELQQDLETIDECLRLVLNIYDEVFDELVQSHSNRHNPLITKAVDYIQKHFHEELTVEKLASHVGFTPNYFSHLFKKEIGVAFNEFLNKKRMEEAKKLLKETGLAGYEIMEKVGFQNYKYFTQVFKKFEGCAPTEYRKNKFKG